ncbi:MAG: divalent-cation tolerance protein CutA [Acidimicrobiia bacterium]|nr:divalent-cation tolerance protein CutA [Acidimicrobiia bacterium]
MTDKIVVFVTVGNSENAAVLAKSLVAKRLAACASLVPGLASWYWWEERVTEDHEVLLAIKTSRDRFAALEKEVLRLHSYAVPEIIALPIVEGSKNYLDWIDESLEGGQ